jgi:NIPSNAP
VDPRSFPQHGIVPIGVWTTLIGPDSASDLNYILAWESLADRETKWNSFLCDPEWLSVRDESEKDASQIAVATAGAAQSEDHSAKQKTSFFDSIGQTEKNSA